MNKNVHKSLLRGLSFTGEFENESNFHLNDIQLSGTEEIQKYFYTISVFSNNSLSMPI